MVSTAFLIEDNSEISFFSLLSLWKTMLYSYKNENKNVVIKLESIRLKYMIIPNIIFPNDVTPTANTQYEKELFIKDIDKTFNVLSL